MQSTEVSAVVVESFMLAASCNMIVVTFVIVTQNS